MFKCFLTLFVTVITSSAFATSAPTFTTDEASIKYTIQKGDVINRILRTMLKKGIYLYADSDLTKKIIADNPHIKNWRQLPPGEVITFRIPHELTNKKSIAEYEKKTKKKLFDTSNLNAGFFYTSSYGVLTEKTNQNITLSSGQNSSLSFSLGLSYVFPKRTQMLSASGYWSKLNNTNVTGTSLVSRSNEFGANVFHGFKFSKYYELYYGLDFESINTLNLHEQQTDGVNLASVNHKIWWASIGSNFIFKISSVPFLLKAAFSMTAKDSSPDLNTANPIKGIKYIIYLNHKFKNDIMVHTFYKKHLFTTPNEKSIDRIALGVGYKFL